MSTVAERLVERALDKQADHEVVALGRGETYENEMWRVHRYADGVEITHLVNAGKKGKKCSRWYIAAGYAQAGYQGPNIDEIGNTAEAVAKTNAQLGKMQETIKAMAAKGARVSEGFPKGVEVKPGNFQKLWVRGIHITIQADYDGFTIEDIDDESNEPTCIAKGKRAVGQFYRWVKDNQKAAQVMTFTEVMQAMDREGIEYHSYCAMD